jgi:Uma2 family endonuclease
MESKTEKRLFTVDELYRMDEVGLFRNQTIELVYGEIFLMSKGRRHQSRVDRATDVLMDAFGRVALLRVQGPLLIDSYNLPEPDIQLVRRRSDYYDSEHPGPKDIFLLLEISDSSLAHDRDVKLALYAISGVSEYWIEDIQQDAILVFRDPSGDTYKTQLTFRRGESLSALAFAGIQLRVEDFLGPLPEAV